MAHIQFTSSMDLKSGTDLYDTGGVLWIDGTVIFDRVANYTTEHVRHDINTIFLLRQAYEKLGLTDRISITTETVSASCETCGTNYDDGGEVWIDDKLVFSYSPVASCYDNKYLDEESLMIIALISLGHSVKDINYDTDKYEKAYEEYVLESKG